MKKLLSVWLVLCVLLTCSAVPAFSAATPVLTAESVSATAGSPFKVTLKLENNPGVAVVSLRLNYPTEKLALTGVSSSLFETDYTVHDGYAQIALMHLSGNQTGESLAQLSFSPIGSGTFSFTPSVTPGAVADEEGKAVSLGVREFTVMVSCQHRYRYVGRKDPTCEQAGGIYYQCSICGEKKTTGTGRADHVEGAWVITEQPDCEHEGIRSLLCGVCQKVLKTEKNSSLGHVYGEYTREVDPGCTTPGYDARTCKVCGYVGRRTVAPRGHDKGVWTVTTPSDCTTGGVSSRLCTICHASLETKQFEGTGHVYGWATVEYPTCTKPGLQAYVCLNCGRYDESKEIPASGHYAGETVITEAICSREGSEITYCRDCSAVMESKTQPKTPHAKTAYRVLKAPTASTEGQGETFCTVCGESTAKQTIPVSSARIELADATAMIGEVMRIPVRIESASTFSAAQLTVSYDPQSLIFDKAEAGLADDLTAGCPTAGQICVVAEKKDGTISEDGVLFYLTFTVTENPTNGRVDIQGFPETVFSDADGNYLFFGHLAGRTYTFSENLNGDANGDGVIDVLDLICLKNFLNGLPQRSPVGVDPERFGEGTPRRSPAGVDFDHNNSLNAVDLAALRKMLADRR